MAAPLWIFFRHSGVFCITGKTETLTGLRTSSNPRPPQLESVPREDRYPLRASGCEVIFGTLGRFIGLLSFSMKYLRHARVSTGSSKAASRVFPMLIFP